MPIKQWVEPDRRRIRAVVDGDCSIFEMLGAIDFAIRDPDFVPGFDVLSDHTKIGEPLTTPQAQAIVTHLEGLAEQMAGSRWAVVTRKPASYGMMRMLSVLIKSVPMRLEVFSSFDEAEQWLASPRLADDSEPLDKGIDSALKGLMPFHTIYPKR